MIDNNNLSLYAYLNSVSLSGNTILLVTKSGLKYITSNLQVLDINSIVFNDKRNDRIFLLISEIAQITEVKK